MSLLIGASSGLQGAAGASAGGSGDLGATIDQSVRFRSEANANLTRTPASAGDRRTWTYSFWYKPGNRTTKAGNAGAGTVTFLSVNKVESNTEYAEFLIESDRITFQGATVTWVMPSARIRDNSAWYHFVLICDTTNATSTDRVRFYLNGDRQTAFEQSSMPSQNDQLAINLDHEHAIGIRQNTTNNPLDGLFAEVHFIDGTAVGETSGVIDEFGRYNDAHVWVPQAYTGSHGTNGYHLTFDSSGKAGQSGAGAALGADHSSGNNHWTANNFETTAIGSSNEDNDIDFNDTPTNNYATISPILARSRNDFSGLNFEKANLRVQYGAGGSIAGMANFGIVGSSGKYYWEVTLKEQKEGGLGIVSEDFDLEKGNNQFGTDTANGGQAWEWILSEGRRDNNNTETGTSHTVPNVGDTIGFLLDTDAGTCTIEINGVAQTSGNGAEFTNIPTDKTIYPYFRLGGASGDANIDWNFGQMAFQHEPSGYQHVATNSLSEPTIKDGRDYFECITWDGNDTDDRDITTTKSFAPDLVWIKCRSATQNHVIFDTCRGATLRLMPNLINDEDTQANDLQVFNSDGFQVGTQARVNASSNTYVAWCWKAGGAPTATNTATGSSAPTSGSVMIDDVASSTALTGTIKASKISANTTAGFSIVSYTGNSTSGATVDHGLGAKPDVVVVKARNPASSQHWHVKHVGLDNESNSVRFDATGGQADFNAWGGLAPDANVFKLGPVDGTNDDTKNYIAYCWRAIEGFSKFGKYETNVNDQGPYVHLGFKPALVILKSIDQDTSVSWKLVDFKRSPINLNTGIRLYGQDNVAETTHANETIDLLANGFKIRGTSNSQNAPDVDKTYIYFAWAQHPFGGENAPPATGF